MGGFNEICCCESGNANDCSKLTSFECKQQVGFVVMNDMKNCEVS